MNLLHLKYAVEVEKNRSINKAAEKLFIGQPNLSRAIKELEANLGISIFKRTTKGISPTPEGEDFLQYAKKILEQVDAVEAMYQNMKIEKQKLLISVPRASYIGYAFTEFVKKIDTSKQIEIFYKETNSMKAISNILQDNYKLGIIRYQTTFDQYFKTLLNEKSLESEDICEFSYVLVFSKDHPLAAKKVVELSDLSGYMEIAHGDPYVPSLPIINVKKAELSEFVTKRIFVFERSSQFDLLSNVPNTFMWVSPISQKLLDQYGLIQRQCASNRKKYKDVLIYREGYQLTSFEKQLISEINKAISVFKMDN